MAQLVLVFLGASENRIYFRLVQGVINSYLTLWHDVSPEGDIMPNI